MSSEPSTADVTTTETPPSSERVVIEIRAFRFAFVVVALTGLALVRGELERRTLAQRKATSEAVAARSELTTRLGELSVDLANETAADTLIESPGEAL